MRDLIIEKILSNKTKYKSFNENILYSLSDEDLVAVIAGEMTAAAAKKAVAENDAITASNFNPNAESDPIISITGLKKTFKSRKEGTKEVHKGIDLEINRGETVAIIGANGAGKTVLMETLVRVLRQDEGQIQYNFEGLHPFEEIGMQFQDADSTGNLTAKDMIDFIKSMYKSKVDDKQLEEMIDIYGIRPYIKSKIKKLSGGQRQRVNLLLATMHNPKLMILDEFITGLDILSVRDILDYIKKLKEENNSTLIIISHQPEEIRQLSNRIFGLKDGVIVGEWLTSDVDRKYRGDFGQFLIDTI